MKDGQTDQQTKQQNNRLINKNNRQNNRLNNRANSVPKAHTPAKRRPHGLLTKYEGPSPTWKGLRPPRPRARAPALVRPRARVLASRAARAVVFDSILYYVSL